MRRFADWSRSSELILSCASAASRSSTILRCAGRIRASASIVGVPGASVGLQLNSRPFSTDFFHPHATASEGVDHSWVCVEGYDRGMFYLSSNVKRSAVRGSDTSSEPNSIDFDVFSSMLSGGKSAAASGQLDRDMGSGLEKTERVEVAVRGSVIVFPRFALSWRPTSMSDISPSDFDVFDSLKMGSEIDMLILGVGKDTNTYPSDSFLEEVRRNNIRAIEVQDSVNAAATYNMLVIEGRNVACALLPIDEP